MCLGIDGGLFYLFVLGRQLMEAKILIVAVLYSITAWPNFWVNYKRVVPFANFSQMRRTYSKESVLRRAF